MNQHLPQQQRLGHEQDQGLPPHSENVEEELGRIQLALNAVFAVSSAPNHADNASQSWWSQRQLADRYLTSFQGTSVAWMVCDRLLHPEETAISTATATPNPLEESVRQQRLFFAAQTLHKKCRNDIFELPQESFPSLRDSLLAHLQRYATSSTTSNGALVTRLAMCVAALAVQMDWSSIVNDLLNNPQATALVLPILRVLPEECASDRLILIDDNHRYSMRDHLVASAPTFFQYLHASIEHSSNADGTNSNFDASVKALSSLRSVTAQQVLQTFHTWIRYVPVHPSALVESPLLPGAVQALTQPAYLEYAADVVVEILRMYPSHHYANESLVQCMIPLLSQLPFAQAMTSSDPDVGRAYCRVVTEMGESYMSLILSRPPELQQQQQPHQHQSHPQSQLVEWVLQCSGMEDWKIASITLHFWYRLVMDLESTEPYDWRQELVDMYTPHLLRLMDVCGEKLMRYPEDILEAPEDVIDDMQKHRFYVSETVEDCCRLLGGHVVLQRIGGLLQRQVQTASANSKTQATEWHGMESRLACITAIHRFVPSDETDVLPFVFSLLPQFPTDIWPLRYTSSQLIGKYASWLAMQSNVLQPLLPYLAQGLNDAKCAPACAVAIKELCECSNPNFSIAEPVLNLYGEISGRLELPDELQVLEGACRAISRHVVQEKHNDGKKYVAQVAQPIVARLSAILADNASASPRKIIPEIDRLTVVTQHLKVPFTPPNIHPIVELLSSCWNLLDAATSRFPSDNHLAEKICRMHKHTLRSCGADAYAPVLDNLMQQLVRSFEQSRQSPFLYAASICITEYGSKPAYTPKLFEMVSALATTVFSFVRNLEDLTNHPDVVEEFFYLMGRMINFCPTPVVLSPLLQSLLRCAVVGMQLDHQGANKGVLRFLEDMISFGLSLREQNKPDCQAALEHVLSQEGQPIVANLARAMVGELPAYNERQIPEILWKLNLLCPSLLSQWLAAAFHGVDQLPERAKVDLMGALSTGLARDEFSLAVRAFQSACHRERRFRKTPQHSHS